MRYRIPEYSAIVGETTVTISIPVSKDVYDSLTVSEGVLDAASLNKVIEAIRLIADETRGGYILCSTGQKSVVSSGSKSYAIIYVVSVTMNKSDLIAAANGDEDDLAAIDAMTGADKFTIEMDWGEAPSGLAKETTLGDVASVLDYIEQGGMPSITAIAKQGNNANATLSDTQAAVVDGNDTAISVSKEVRSEVGTGSDTAAETGTLFAVVKWVKDKVKSIYNLIGTPATGQPSTLFAAIAAGGGGGSADALETEVETGKAEIATAIESKGGTASASMSLAQLAGAVDNLSIPTLLRLGSYQPTYVFENSAQNEIIDLSAVGSWSLTSLSFSGFNSVKKIINLPEMPNLTSLANTFYNCSSLQEVKFGRIATGNVTNFGGLFNGCASLEEVDMSMLDSTSATATGGLFQNTANLRKVNMRGFHFAGGAYNMFNGTPSITWIDMTNTDASGVTAIADFFVNNYLLETLVGDATYQDVVDNDVKILEGLNVGWNTRLNTSTFINQASLRALLNGLADRSEQSALTLTIGSDNIAKLSAADIAIATNKNWTLA